MAREGSFTHVRRELRPRAGISACMVTGGWSFTHVRRELWPRVILGYRLMGISACMAREGSFTHVRRVLRPRVGISACMVTGGWSFTHVRREHWPRVIFGSSWVIYTDSVVDNHQADYQLYLCSGV